MSDTADIVERLTVEQFDELIDTLNEVFSEHAPHDFRRLIPAIYRPTPEHAGHNLIIRRDGCIAAIVGVFPIEWRIGNRTLRVAGIGGVATRLAYRGQGLMRTLMHAAIEQIQRDGYHLSYLGGQRQRYRYYGWECAGTALRMRLTQDNLHHALPADSLPRLTLCPMSENPALLDQVAALHQSQSTYCVRPRDVLADYLHQWHRQAWVACDEADKIRGYVVGRKEGGTVTELVGEDAPATLATAAAWVMMVGNDEFLVPSLIDDRLRAVDAVAEQTTIQSSGNWRIFDWPATISALLAARHAASPLPQGEVTIHITDRQTTLGLTVDEHQCACQTMAPGAPADLSIDSLKATRLLFGPVPPHIVADLPVSAAILSAWCPLPLAIPQMDHV